MVRSTRSFIYKFPNMDGHLPELISSSRKSREVPRWGGGGERTKRMEKRVKELREEESGKGRGGARQERERDQREREMDGVGTK